MHDKLEARTECSLLAVNYVVQFTLVNPAGC